MTSDKCAVCDREMPEWPSGWRFLDDGRAFCPDHKGELPWQGRVDAPAEGD